MVLLRECLGRLVFAALLGVGSLALPSASARAAERVTLVKGGRPAATLVTPAQPEERVAWAARELQGYVRKLSGVEIPILSDGKAAAGTGLYVGACEPSLESDPPAPGTNPEAYAIRVRGGNVYFAGRYPTPIAFAVVSFLEEDLGIRWFAPGELWEYLPQGKPGELSILVRERVKVPDTSPRIWSGHDWAPSWKAWNLRNKTVLSEVVPRRQFQNNLHRIFPPQRFARTHPEYYPLMANGSRFIPPPDAGPYWRPCESHPEVTNATVAYARKWFDAHPLADSFSVGMDDVSHLCSCAHCRALDPAPDSYEKHEFSDRHYRFVNAVAGEVAKTHPDRYVGTLIYAIARELPRTVPKLEDNVFGYITETSARWWDENRKRKDQALTCEWAKRCKHLSRYDYFGMGTMTPRVYPHLMAEQIRFDKSLGLEGMYTEVYTFPPNTAPMIWAFAKMQWDANADVDALLDEFYAKMFGRAAGTMRAYFDLLERSWCTPRPGRDGWVHRNLVRQALAMSPGDVDAGFALLGRAAGEADTDAARKRIDVVRGGLTYGSQVIKAYALTQKLMRARVRSEADARGVLRLATQVSSLSDQRRLFWKAAESRDDLLGETVRGLGGIGYLAADQLPAVEGGAWLGAIKALGWYASHDPGSIDAVVSEAAANAPGSDVARLLRAWAATLRTKPVNLAANGDFEARGSNPARPEADWQTEAAPPSWSTWSREPGTRFALAGGKGCAGPAAAAISGADSASYLQTVPVKPGERYLCSVRVKRQGKGGASLAVRYRTPTGAWHPRRELESQMQAADDDADWQLLVLMVEAPEGAGSAVVMLSATAQEKGAATLFDDARLVRVPAE